MSDSPENTQMLEAIQALRRMRGLMENVESALQETYGVTVQGLLQQAEKQEPADVETEKQNLDFSLFYFSQDTHQADMYRLLIEGATFADQNGFSAVWLPERHFHEFGGPFPNPSVLAAALAVKTKKIRLRAGSVVLPLHHPVRVVEDWSVIDNLSDGRVDLAFVPGWNADDFLFAPNHFENRKDVMAQNMDTMSQLWRGDVVSFPNGKGEEATVCTYPRPIQPELPAWLTCTGSLEGFVEAGRFGRDILTALLFQSVDELAEKIVAYKDAREAAGYDRETGRVALMLHTFVGQDEREIERVAKPAFVAYLESSVALWRQSNIDLDQLDDRARRRVLEVAYERYRRTASLIGTVDECQQMAQRVMDAGVTEIASLIDFGIDDDLVLASLNTLNILRKKINTPKQVQDTQELVSVLSESLVGYQMVIHQPKPSARLRLFCLPYAGGSPSVFAGWPNALPDDVEMCVLGMPPNCSTLSELFDVLLPELQNHLDKPFAFYGHSVGGFIAFELARKLRALFQVEPEHLFIGSQQAPQATFPYPDPSFLMTPDGFETLRALTPIHLPDSVKENEALLKRLLRPIIPAVALQHETYTYMPQAALNCPITVFGGTQDPVLNEHLLSLWRVHTAKEFDLHMLPTGHIFSGEQHMQVIEKISSSLRV